jgi:BirA family transcriptional regulator, biotin operon repressor / biotin---[acetyl-CoA-carboxylase] ligase
MTLDAQILTLLRAAVHGVSGAELAERAGVSRALLRARVEELRALGYGVEASPHRGYRLVSTPDLLHADDLLSRLGRTRVIGRDIRVFQETTSTNDVVEKLARDGVAEGVVVFAEAQSRGRGRLGRKWASPAGQGLWFSVLLRPALAPQAMTRLTVAAATALARAIRTHCALLPQIKWPNDLLLDGRKCGGILTEMSGELDAVRYAILGVGVDVNQTARDMPPDLRRVATSLRAESGAVVDRAALAAVVLRELDRDYTRLGTGRFEEIAEEWEQLCTTIGRSVVVRIGARSIEGRAEALDPDGALLLRTQHGHLERILGGDVTVGK